MDQYLNLMSLYDKSLAVSHVVMAMAQGTGSAKWIADSCNEWQQGGVDAGLIERVREVNAQPDWHPSKIRDELLFVRGRIAGQLVQEDGFPAAVKEHLANVIRGGGAMTRDGILEAYQHIQPTFIRGLLTQLGIEPAPQPGINGPRYLVQPTPLIYCAELSKILKRPVYLKMANQTLVGSYKIYGGTNAAVILILAGKDPKAIRVGIGSHGNASLGTILGMHNLGIEQVVAILPNHVSPLKEKMNRDFGGEVRRLGETFEQAVAEARRRMAETPETRFLIHAYDHVAVAEGQGAIGIELSLQLAALGFKMKDVSLVVPGGGGGLLSGLSLALPRHKIYVVESESHHYIHQSLQAGRRISAPDMGQHRDTHAEGTALLEVGHVNWPVIQKAVPKERSLVVQEADIDKTLAFFWRELGIRAEGAGILSTAAMLFGGLNTQQPGRPVVLVVSGHNIEPELHASIVADYGHRWSEGLRV